MPIRQELALGMDVGNAAFGERQAAVAISESGEHYLGAYFNSQSSLLDVDASMSALYNASQHRDYRIRKIAIMSEAETTPTISPVTSQFIIDYARRSGRRNITIDVLDSRGELRYRVDELESLAPFYAPYVLDVSLDFVEQMQDAQPQATSMPKPPIASVTFLREAARIGSERAFLRYDQATRYGSAVETADTIYYGGQYSSYDGRTNIHAEMGATILARLDGATEISAIGIASQKFTSEPAQMCGCCRQFLHEMTQNDPTAHLFGWDEDVHESLPLSEYLPATWSANL